MKTRTLRQTVTFTGAAPADVYRLMADSRRHAALSGEKAVISKRVGGAFSAWGGHLQGFNLLLRPPEKIVQAWRATGWWPDHYSIVTFEFARVAVGTRLTFTQIGIPPQRYSGHQRGWIETYWTPMKEVLADGHVSEKTLARVKVNLERRIKRGHFRRAISNAG